ncbi:YajQ family cyclic di-GMP-binding protein [Bacteriovorax sp. PP10]|uniref:Nucleotide-binding protein SHI21_15130 n=1 Tax=Bacteriovorax antarcticus TaxID=3088717 RepID=A0ABU5VZX6_9BACT|nr:YajQ family cyclic di-GMP-binding protein [Bacteriovorax sp. PP10]MEA9357560.1 YajQ family cyclic di-GMP-binding protein [Bacteriovorax sp. PP10]
MPSFDLVSKTDMMEMKNAILMAQKEINARYDFKGSDVSLELKDTTIELKAEDDYKMKAALEILRGQLVKRNIGQRCIDPQKIEPSGNRMMKQTINIKNGIEKEKAKAINKIIKESGLKVTSSIMDDKIRMTAKKIDDLQGAYQMLRTNKEVDIELQMENMKRD